MPTSTARRLYRVNTAIDQTLQSMRDGHALYLHHDRGRPHWYLSDGTTIDDEVARVVITKTKVIGVGGALFAGCLGQAWRYSED